MRAREENGDLKRIDIYYKDGKLVNKNCLTTEFEPDTSWSFLRTHDHVNGFDEHLIFTSDGEDSGVILGRMGSLSDCPENYLDNKIGCDYRAIGKIPNKSLEEIDEEFQKISEY